MKRPAGKVQRRTPLESRDRPAKPRSKRPGVKRSPLRRAQPTRNSEPRDQDGVRLSRTRAPRLTRARDARRSSLDLDSDSAEKRSAPESTVKLQKRLAEAGLGSRRSMEELIQSGEVSVNGKLARLGMRVGTDERIVVRGELVSGRAARAAARLPRIVIYHKPEGEIVSKDDPEGRVSVFDRAAFLQRGRWLAVGRLDFNTCGLLVFTDSGELANRLSHPRFQVQRDYAVRILGELTVEQVRLLKTGVHLEDGNARFEMLESQGGEGSNRWYRVRVREGRNRLVRRMFSAIGLTVSRLMRTRFGPFELPPRLKRGQWERLEDKEVERAMTSLTGGGHVPRTVKNRPMPAQRESQAAEFRRAEAGKSHRRPRWSRAK